MVKAGRQRELRAVVLHCSSGVKAVSDAGEGHRAPSSSSSSPGVEHKHSESQNLGLRAVLWPQHPSQCGSGGRKSWQIPSQTQTWAYTSWVDWQKFWSQDVSSGETQLVSEDHSLPQPLNAQIHKKGWMPKSLTSWGFQFTLSIQTPALCNTCRMQTGIDSKGKQFSTWRRN